MGTQDFPRREEFCECPIQLVVSIKEFQFLVFPEQDETSSKQMQHIQCLRHSPEYNSSCGEEHEALKIRGNGVSRSAISGGTLTPIQPRLLLDVFGPGSQSMLLHVRVYCWLKRIPHYIQVEEARINMHSTHKMT